MTTIIPYLNSFKNLKVLALTIFLALTGCAAGEYGDLRRDIALTDTFEANLVLPGYNYYFAGSRTMPDAILGLKKEYTLNESYWKPIELTEVQLTRWTELIGHYYQPSYQHHLYFAYHIYDPDDQQIGVWYGYTDQTSIIKTGPATYTIYPPPQSSLKGVHRNFPGPGFNLSP